MPKIDEMLKMMEKAMKKDWTAMYSLVESSNSDLIQFEDWWIPKSFFSNYSLINLIFGAFAHWSFGQINIFCYQNDIIEGHTKWIISSGPLFLVTKVANGKRKNN